MFGKVLGFAGGFALGGPLGAVVGTLLGHAVDRSIPKTAKADARPEKPRAAAPPPRRQPAAETPPPREVEIRNLVIALGAKIAKADGAVSRDEIAALKKVFQTPADQADAVGRVFNEAKRTVDGYEAAAASLGRLLAREPLRRERVLDGLFAIAMSDGVLHQTEARMLHTIAARMGIDKAGFARIRGKHQPKSAPRRNAAYDALGVTPEATDAEIKARYRALIRALHPDVLAARRAPEDEIAAANAKLADINAAYDKIAKARGL